METNKLITAFKMIATIKRESLQIGLNEVFSADQNSKLEKWLDEEVALIHLDREFHEIVKHFSSHKPIFVQHISPVHVTVKINGSSKDVETIVTGVQDVIDLLDKEKSFSVQTRFVGSVKRTYKKFTMNQQVSQMVEQAGCALNITDPEQVISIVLSEDYGYIGLSLAKSNLSSWAGGKHRFAKEANQISRAEFKLLEAIDVFDISLPKKGVALDLGAAPGGWTRVLRKSNLIVYAVDPANLDQRLKKDPNIIHVKETAQIFLRKYRNVKFDLIVNDMKMDVKESVALMADFRNQLRPNGLAIMTLKLKKKNIYKTTLRTIDKLKQSYQILNARQLFHNRSEVTLVMRNK